MTDRQWSFEPDSHCVQHVHKSENYGTRAVGFKIDVIILHYTGMASVDRAIHWLSVPESQVSCHYVVDESGLITQLVPEALRAWHAGVSSWHGITDINSSSIGIEIQNPGHGLGYPDFPHSQMIAVRNLCLDIMNRHSIVKHRVLAHSDIAPKRKIDPGEKFDWRMLAKAGVGVWVETPNSIGGTILKLGDEGDSVKDFQRNLVRYGYKVECHGCYDDETQTVARAFQRHFRPDLVDGRIDQSTIDVLAALLAQV